MKVGTLATVTGSILCTMQETVAALKLGHRSPVKPRYKSSGTGSLQTICNKSSGTGSGIQVQALCKQLEKGGLCIEMVSSNFTAVQ